MATRRKPISLFRGLAARIRKSFYGRTFACPVCHLELSYYDVNEDGLLVCPLCGAVLELAEVIGHALPVVHDIEIRRPQPKLRLHPVLTHLPVGLFPFGLLGAVFLAFVSLACGLFPGLDAVRGAGSSPFFAALPVVHQLVLIMLGVSVFVSLFTALSGAWDWIFRYGRRPYRLIRMKIILSVVFFVLAAAAFALQLSGVVFNPSSGLIPGSASAVLCSLLYLGLLGLAMAAIGVLGHIGGELVFGK